MIPTDKITAGIIGRAKILAKSLTATYSPEEAGKISQMVAAHIAGIEYKELKIRHLTRESGRSEELDNFAELPKNVDLLFKKMEIRLLKGEPVQYVLGYSWFLNRKFSVNPSVLIPRPETEELVLLVMEEWKKIKPPKILDIGTGSGCIAISLALELPGSTVFATDISENALQAAKKNAASLKADVKFFKSDILNPSTAPEDHFDLIVSNPPYVRMSEKLQMHPNVLEWEPSGALFVEDTDPLVFYNAISYFANLNLNPGGKLYFEVNSDFAKQVKYLFDILGFADIEIRKDVFGMERFVKGTRFI